MNLIMYSSSDEVLVTTPEFEASFLQDYFIDGGRDTLDYDREEAKNVVEINVTARVSAA